MWSHWCLKRLEARWASCNPAHNAAWIRPVPASLLWRGETHFPADRSSAHLPLLSRNCPLWDFCCLTARGSSFNPHHVFITTLAGDLGLIIYWGYISICDEAVGGKYTPINKKQTHTTSLSHFLPLLAGPGYALHTKGAQHLTGRVIALDTFLGCQEKFKKNSDQWSNKKTSLRWLRAFISYVLQIIHYKKILFP